MNDEEISRLQEILKNYERLKRSSQRQRRLVLSITSLMLIVEAVYFHLIGASVVSVVAGFCFGVAFTVLILAELNDRLWRL